MSARPRAGVSSNQYEILSHLATGGMAELFLARSRADGFDRYVVLKRILPERSADPNFVAMFLDEARLAAQLNHPNIAQVFDVGLVEGDYFFTMEYVHGKDLGGVLKLLAQKKGEFSVAQAMTITAAAAAGLHHAHERTGPTGAPLGIVHRDVSPANLMLSYTGEIKLVDFGIAKATERESQTQAGAIKGKIGYLAPEQCTGRPVDRRTDIFALGVVLHELLTTQRLFRRDNEYQTMVAIVREPVTPVSKFRNDIPPGLDDLLATALVKDPQHRFSTAAAMLGALEAVAQRAGITLTGGPLAQTMRDLFGAVPAPWEASDFGPGSSTTQVTTTSVLGARRPSSARLGTPAAPRPEPDTVPPRIEADTLPPTNEPAHDDDDREAQAHVATTSDSLGEASALVRAERARARKGPDTDPLPPSSIPAPPVLPTSRPAPAAAPPRAVAPPAARRDDDDDDDDDDDRRSSRGDHDPHDTLPSDAFPKGARRSRNAPIAEPASSIAPMPSRLSGPHLAGLGGTDSSRRDPSRVGLGAPPTAPTFATAAPQPQAAPRWPYLVGAGVAIAVGGAAFLLFRGDDGPATPSAVVRDAGRPAPADAALADGPAGPVLVTDHPLVDAAPAAGTSASKERARFQAQLDECGKLGRAALETTPACAIAACELSDFALAKRYWQSLRKANRETANSACHRVGMDFDRSDSP